jgi:hypothetical protein
LESIETVFNQDLNGDGVIGVPVPKGIAVTATTSDAVQGGPAVTLLTAAPTITDPASTTIASATIQIRQAKPRLAQRARIRRVQSAERQSIRKQAPASD